MDHIEFPKWKYASGGRSVIVNDPAEEAALGPGWADTPAAFAESETKAAPEVEKPQADAKKPEKPKKSKKDE